MRTVVRPAQSSTHSGGDGHQPASTQRKTEGSNTAYEELKNVASGRDRPPAGRSVRALTEGTARGNAESPSSPETGRADGPADGERLWVEEASTR